MTAGADSQSLAHLAFNSPPQSPAVLAGSFALNLLALAMPLAMLQIFDRIIPFQSTGTLMVFLIGLVAVTAMELVLRLARIVLLGHAGAEFETKLGAQVLDHMLKSVPSDHERNTAGTHFERFSAITQLREHHAGQARLLAIDLPFTVIFVGLIALIGGWLVLVPLSILAVIALSGAIMRAVQAGLLEKRTSVDSRRYSFLIEFLSQIATVKSCRMEGQMLRRYEMLHAQSIDASRRIIALAGASQTFGAVLGQVAVAAMGLCGASLVIEGMIGIGDLAACMLLNGRTTQPMLKLLGLMSQHEGKRQAQAKIGEISATPLRAMKQPPVSLTKGAIALRNVGFRHPASGAMVFEGLTDNIAPSERIALRSGDAGGRSSLMRMILAEQAPSEGQVRIDDFPATIFGDTRGPGGIAILDQDPVIFRGTILDNITLFGSIGPRDHALAISESVGLGIDVRALPLGYQTLVGAGGGVHSLGFLQRICIARVLCLGPRILLFNNAASAVDSPTATLVAGAISDHAGDATLILVASQPGLSALATRDLWLSRPAASLVMRDTWDSDSALEQAMAETRRKQSA